MKEYISGSVYRTCASFLILASQSVPSKAADSIGTPLFEVSQLAKITGHVAERVIGLHGDVSLLSHNAMLVRDHEHNQHFVRVDIQGIHPDDRMRLFHECSSVICSEIVIGRLVDGMLRASASYSY